METRTLAVYGGRLFVSALLFSAGLAWFFGQATTNVGFVAWSLLAGFVCAAIIGFILVYK